jgi:hypothetical protein
MDCNSFESSSCGNGARIGWHRPIQIRPTRKRHRSFEETNMNYKPRRANKRWLEGAPEYVLSCHDNGGKTHDRYTVFFGGSLQHTPAPWIKGAECTNPGNFPINYLALSKNPFDPQSGFCQSGEMLAYERAQFMNSPLGRKCRWLDLPEDVRQAVVNWATVEEQQ